MKLLKGGKTVKQTSCMPIILLAGLGSRLKKDLPGPKGLAQVGKETLLSLQLKRFDKDFQKPIVVVREEEKAFYKSYLAHFGLDATLIVDKNPVGPPSSLLAAVKATKNKPAMVIVALGDSVCISNRILGYAMAPKDGNGAISVARTNINNMGSAAVIHKRGLLLGIQPKESRVTWRWAGTVVMPFEWVERIPVSEKLLPQIAVLSNRGACFKIVKEPGQSVNVNTIVELRAVNYLLDVCAQLS